MMTHVQYLLIKLAEESTEVAKEALKGSQFGTDSEYKDTANGQRIQSEFIDLMTILHMLQIWGDPGIGQPLTELEFNRTADLDLIEERMPKVCYYMIKSHSAGNVDIPVEFCSAILKYAHRYTETGDINKLSMKLEYVFPLYAGKPKTFEQRSAANVFRPHRHAITRKFDDDIPF